MYRPLPLLAAALFAAFAPGLSAQQLVAPVKPVQLQDDAVLPRKQALTIQPISIIVGFYSAEYEHAISPAATLGLGASYLDGFVGEDDPFEPTYLSVDAKLRYYPGERPLRGFSFGLTGGYSRVSSKECDYDINFDCTVRTTSSSGGPSIGFQLDYNWLLGRKENFVVALGVGAKRLFVTDHSEDVTVAYPTARVSVGMAF